MANIVWLSSFPRSGNTWLRYVLSGLLQKSTEAKIDIVPTLHCANRKVIEETLGFSASVLSVAELNNCRPHVYRQWSKEWTQTSPLLIKVHDCYDQNQNGQPIFPSDVTQAAIHLIRNPLDICVSYAHFWGLEDYDKAADLICDTKHSLPAHHNDLFGQVYQHIGDWSTHVHSWCHQTHIPLKKVRYEDMKHATLDTFYEIMTYLNLPFSRNEVQTALRQCDIAKLQQQEAEMGFSHRPYGGEKFFRQGKTGEWQDTLAQHTVDRIVEQHHALMQQFGYLDEHGKPQ